jgi:hypothetical protein
MRWRTIVISMLLAFLAGCQMTVAPADPAKAEQKKAEDEMVERIRQYKIILEEARLSKEILILKSDIANINKGGVPQKMETKE